MSNREVLDPKLPDELTPLFGEAERETHHRWQSLDLRTVRQRMDSVEECRWPGAVVLRPAGDADTDNWIGLYLPHGQGWKPSMYVRAELTRQVVAPDSPMAVFLGAGYNFTLQQRKKVACGDLSPIARSSLQVLEAFRPRHVSLTGYSRGGLVAAAAAVEGANIFDVAHVNIDEAPYGQRTKRQLGEDFRASGGWEMQRLAVADARLPGLSEALSPPRLARDYAGFLVTLLRSEQRAVVAGMAQSALAKEIIRISRETHIKVGYVVGSRIFSNDSLVRSMRIAAAEYGVNFAQWYGHSGALRTTAYTGAAARGHTTGDNAWAHALMVKDGLMK